LNKRIILAAVAIASVFILFTFGKTTTLKKETPAASSSVSNAFNFQDSLQAAKQTLTASQLVFVTNIENNI